MKKTIVLLMVLFVFLSCKEEVVQKPDRLIAKEQMMDIMYDLALLDGIKYQTPTAADTIKINPKEYVLKKYKVDSLQFAKSNIYYASNYTEYKDMFDQIIKRIDDRKAVIDSIIKIEDKNKLKIDSAKQLKKPLIKTDSVINLKRRTDKLEAIQKKEANKNILTEESQMVR